MVENKLILPIDVRQAGTFSFVDKLPPSDSWSKDTKVFL